MGRENQFLPPLTKAATPPLLKPTVDIHPLTCFLTPFEAWISLAFEWEIKFWTGFKLGARVFAWSLNWKLNLLGRGSFLRSPCVYVVFWCISLANFMLLFELRSPTYCENLSRDMSWKLLDHLLYYVFVEMNL